MTEIAGRKVELQYYAGGDFSGSGVKVARARTIGFKLDKEPIDITTMDSGAWTDLLDMVGRASAEITLACVCLGAAAHRTLVGLSASVADGAQLHAFEVVLPGLGKWQGDWFITNHTHGADYGPEAATLEITLTSSGAAVFVADTA